MSVLKTESHVRLAARFSAVKYILGAERDIDKRDLQAAVLHGTAEQQVRVVRGRRIVRYKFTFAGVIYITDSTRTMEITSFPEPVLVDNVAITHAMTLAHARALEVILTQPERWTSHTVIVVDQSGSMKKSDMRDCSNRADAVWVALSLDWVAPRLEKGDAKATDVVSLVTMNDEATVLLTHEPLDWL